MTDMTVALRLQVEGAQAWAAAARSARQEIEGVGQASSGSARALAETSSALAKAAPAARASAQAVAQVDQQAAKAAQSVGRLRDENGRFVKAGSEAAASAAKAASGFAQVGSAAGSAAGGIGSLRGALGGILASVRSANDEVGDLASSIRGLGAVVVGGFTLEAAASLAKGAFDAAAAWQTLEGRIKFLSGSQAAANEETALAARLADDLATSERSVLDLRARMLPLERSGRSAAKTASRSPGG